MMRKTFTLLLLCGYALTSEAITREIGQQNITIEFYSPTIVRVSKTALGVALDKNGWPKDKKSYAVILKGKAPADLKNDENNDSIILTSANIRVCLDKKSGHITFADTKGNTLLLDEGTTISPRTDKTNEGKYKLEEHFLLYSKEAVYGLGQLREPYMNQRGRRIDLWNWNGHITMPYFTSEKGYGVYWDNAGRSTFDDSGKNTVISSEVGLGADYYFMYRDGSQDGVIASIRQLTGQATMFPLWTMGFWQSRERYKTSDELASVLDRYRELKIPVDAIVQDWQYWGCDSNWNAMKFQNPYYINKVGDAAWAKYLPKDMRKMKQQTPRLKTPEEMVEYVHNNNAHLMITIWANFGPWTEQYKELENINALLPFDTWPRNAGVKPYDVFNPKARDIYWRYLTNLYRMGFDAWWTDSSEPDHFEKDGDSDYQTYDGSWLSVKNAFPLLHNKSIYEHQRAMKGNSKRAFQMTRSGSFGIQHYGTFSWSGDIKASWQEMKQQIPSGLNYTLCGIPFWNTDLGGFFYGDYQQSPKNPAVQELQTRWMQWGTFMPLMRNHCSSPMLSEIYEFGVKGDWCYDAIVDAIRLRYRLLPYIYSNAADCVQRSGSMMRALVMDYKDDSKAIRLTDEYLFGRSILVKPITDPMFTWKDKKRQGHEMYPDLRLASAPVTTYLPKGDKWYDFWTNLQYEGGQDIMRAYDINTIPVYIKAGTVMPFGPEVQYSGEKSWDNLEIRVYPGTDGKFTLYEDQGDGYDYEKGVFSEITFSWSDADHKLTIGKRKGAYKGMLQKRRFKIVLVGADSGSGHLPMKAQTTIEYDGNEKSVSLNL